MSVIRVLRLSPCLIHPGAGNILPLYILRDRARVIASTKMRVKGRVNT